MSKTMNRLATDDAVWESHLRHLLQELFDDSIAMFRGWKVACDDPATPLSQRVDWRRSTELLRWWNDPIRINMTDAEGQPLRHVSRKETVAFLVHYDMYRRAPPTRDPGIGHRFNFLTHDVPLREYYHRVGHMSYLVLENKVLQQDADDEPHSHEYCKKSFIKLWKHSEFKNLPKIAWCF